MPRFQSARQRAHAKFLRQNMTEAEKVLWYHLRAHRFRGLSIRRQAPIGPYIVDFVIPSLRLIIEADGGQHAEPGADKARTAFLENQDYRVLRFWNNEILRQRTAVLDVLDREIGQAIAQDPLPIPPPGRQGTSGAQVRRLRDQRLRPLSQR